MSNQQNNFSFSKRFISGEAHFAFWNSASKGIGLFNTFFIISALSLYEYGVFQLILAAYSIFSSAIHLGASVVGNDILRFTGKGEEGKAKRLFYEYNLLRIVVAIIMWALFFFGSELLAFKYKPDFIAFIKIISFLFFSDALISSAKTILSLRLNFKAIASRSAIGKLVQLAILSYFFFFSNIGTKEVLISVIFASFVSLLFLMPAVIKGYMPWVSVGIPRDFILYKLFYTYGKWEILRQFFTKFTSKIEPWLIKIFIGTEAVAIFSVAQSMLGLLASFLPTKTLHTLIPMKIKDGGTLQKVYIFGTKYMLVFSIAIGIIGLILAPVFIGIFFEKYKISLPYFYFLLLLLPLSALGSVASAFLVAFRKQKFLFFQKILKLVVGLPLYFILLPAFGLWGMVIHAIILSIILFSVMQIYIQKAKLDIRFDWAEFASFGKEDKIFYGSIRKDLKKYLKNKLPAFLL